MGRPLEDVWRMKMLLSVCFSPFLRVFAFISVCYADAESVFGSAARTGQPGKFRGVLKSGKRKIESLKAGAWEASAPPESGDRGNLKMRQEKVEELAFRVVGDMGGAFTMALGYVGDRLGLFRAMAGVGPMTSEELAAKTQLNERYVREWLRAMVAAEYLDYEPVSRKYVMNEEQTFVFGNEDSPMFVGGAFLFTAPSIYNVPKIMEAFRKGGGIPYTEIGDEIPEAIERFFRPGSFISLSRTG